MKRNTLLKPLDILVLGLATVLTLATGGVMYSGNSSTSQVIIRSPDKTWVYPLDTELSINIVGPIGETTVEIHRGRAVIVSSPCGGQSCVASGELHRNGQWAACLPNRVFVLVEGMDGGDAIDAASW